jgi:colanic acid/amylovoran biosynthesis glycosyltransferase
MGAIHYMTTIGVGGAWVGNELRVLSRENVPFVLHSLNPPADVFYAADDIAEIDRHTRVIYPLPAGRAAAAVALAPFRFGGRFLSALWNALTGERESLRIRAVGLWHLAVACHWAAALRSEDVRLVHSQWIHSGGTVAMYGAWLLGVPFSFTGHAADLFRDRAALRDKIRRAEFIVCISEFHRRFFLDNGARAEQLFIAYCGIDTSHFSPRRRIRPDEAPFHILSSGRLVEKKGFDVLIRACGILRERGLPFRCTIAGSGPLEGELRAQAATAGLHDLVTITGRALRQEDIPEFMAEGDVYCLPCVWARDNDVDGLPMMLMEAMACGLPAVSTDLVGIPDLCIPETTGLLTQPGDAEGLADALERLAHDPALADRLAAAGRTHVLETFDLGTCLEPLLAQFRKRLEPRA